MIQETFERVSKVVPKENIFVSTTVTYCPLVLEQLPKIKEENLIIEPVSRNTGPAIALSSKTIEALDPEAVVATIASDHAIDNLEEFTLTLRSAFATVSEHRDKLMTVGINPTSPDTGLGYIKIGQEFSAHQEKRVFFVDAFKEKPDKKTAEEYLASWEYLWNAGYFIFSARTFSEWTKEFSPELFSAIASIAEKQREGKLDEKTLAEMYEKAPSEALEPLLVEKLSPEKRLVIPSSLKWSDVGNWKTLFDFLSEKNNSSIVSSGKHIDLGSKNILVHSNDRLIATLGLKDIIVVDTNDAILIAHKDSVSNEIKKLIEELKEKDSNYL